MRLIPLIALLAIGAAGPGLAADKSFPGVEKTMPAEDYARAGLGKLTPAERRSLDEWLSRYMAGEAAAVRREVEQEQAAAPAPDRPAAGPIVARIKPPFDGWSGNTIFYLDNGQVWRQRMTGRYRFDGGDTEVEIRENVFGFYIMTLKSTGRSIGVSQVAERELSRR